MRVYIIPSEEVSDARLRTISEIISKHKGPVEFVFPEENSDLEEGDNEDNGPGALQPDRDFLPKKLPWSVLFTNCEDFRSQNKKISPEDLVIFLTDHGNFNDQGKEGNWFSSWDPTGKLNFFIQTSGWDNYIESEERYPIVYEIIALLLFSSTCNDQEEVLTMAHFDPPKGTGPRGCPWDFCGDKSQVELKLRTGDVCPDCREKMLEKNIDPALARQIFAIMDDIRGQMLFRKQFGITKQASRLELNKVKEKLFFTDIGNISIKLSPRELTLYWFFLNHPEGVEYAFVADHIEEIKFLYGHFIDEANLPPFINTINNMVYSDNGDFKILSEVVSKIKKKITRTVGAEIASSYTIRQDGVRHVISLDRELVHIN